MALRFILGDGPLERGALAKKAVIAMIAEGAAREGKIDEARAGLRLLEAFAGREGDPSISASARRLVSAASVGRPKAGSGARRAKKQKKQKRLQQQKKRERMQKQAGRKKPGKGGGGPKGKGGGGGGKKR
jgi:hypothetical protein